MANRVILKNYSSTMRALSRVDKGTAKVVRDELKQAGTAVASEAQKRIGVFQGASTSTIGPRASSKGVFVTQRKRKVTGLRGDFGAKQMRILIGVAHDKEAETIEAVEDAFDRLVRQHGF